MGILKTTTIIGAPITTTASTLNEDGSVNKKNLIPILAAGAVSTGTIGMSYVLNQHDLKKIHERAATSYLDSMSDEELVSALEQLNMLEAENNQKNSNKTI